MMTVITTTKLKQDANTNTSGTQPYRSVSNKLTTAQAGSPASCSLRWQHPMPGC